jgi:hypothetical protein
MVEEEQPCHVVARCVVVFTESVLADASTYSSRLVENTILFPKSDCSSS